MVAIKGLDKMPDIYFRQPINEGNKTNPIALTDEEATAATFYYHYHTKKLNF